MPRYRDHRQLDLWMSPQPPRNYDPNPADVRAELLDKLARARAAPADPWPIGERSLWGMIFPQMANWLPDEEAERLRAEFRAELARIDEEEGKGT